MPKVFISHSSCDKEFTFRLARDLKNVGIPVWFDAWEIKVGDSIVEKIGTGLQESDYLIVILSNASTSSRWVQEELSAAKTIEIGKKGVFILPALIETCNIPPMIASKRYADFRTSYESGLKELIDVFGRTHVKESEAKRYQILEEEWDEKLDTIAREISRVITLEQGETDKEFFLTEDYSDENISDLRKNILDAIDTYRALRPLEKSKYLASHIDGSAYFISILAKANDLQLEILENSYSTMVGIGPGVYLSIGVTQASCGLKDRSIWTFRKAIRIVIDFKNSWEDALFAITYHLSRYISFLQVAPEQDLAVDLLLKDEDYLKTRYEQTIECYRIALEKEMRWHLDKNPDHRVTYANLMEAVGFFREALGYIERAVVDFPDHKEFRERARTIREYIEPMKTKGGHLIKASGIYKLPPFFAEFGQRYRFDEMIEEYEPEFWKDVIGDFDYTIDSDLISRLFPAE